MKKRFTEAQIVVFLREADAGRGREGPVPEARILGGELLPLAEQVRRNECFRREALSKSSRPKTPA
jgi:hypothetical protein